MTATRNIQLAVLFAVLLTGGLLAWTNTPLPGAVTMGSLLIIGVAYQLTKNQRLVLSALMLVFVTILGLLIVASPSVSGPDFDNVINLIATAASLGTAVVSALSALLHVRVHLKPSAAPTAAAVDALTEFTQRVDRDINILKYGLHFLTLMLGVLAALSAAVSLQLLGAFNWSAPDPVIATMLVLVAPIVSIGCHFGAESLKWSLRIWAGLMVLAYLYSKIA